MYSDGELSACDPSILSQDEYSAVERVFFAVGSPGGDKVLYLVDVYPHLISQSFIETSGIPPEIKGYRILLVRRDGQWQESWRVRIRVDLSPGSSSQSILHITLPCLSRINLTRDFSCL